jgi:hypothetical protein
LLNYSLKLNNLNLKTFSTYFTTFQRLMKRLLRHLPFLVTYNDDRLIASRMLGGQFLASGQVVTVLRHSGLRINPTKFVFGALSWSFCAPRTVSFPVAKHVEAVRQFPQPQYLKSLRQFLGLPVLVWFGWTVAAPH